MVRTLSESDALEFDCPENLSRSRLEATYDHDPSKPFRGILIGLAIVTPLWAVIGVILYLAL
jgi:hypothetical protein